MSAMSIRLHCGINCSRPHISRQPRSITRCFDPQNPVTSVNDSTVNKTCSFRPCIDIHKVRRSCCVSCSTQESTVHALHTLTLQGQVKQIVGSSLQGSSEDKYVSCRSGRSGMQWHFAFFLGICSSTCAGVWSPTLHQNSLLNTMPVCTSKMTYQEATSSCWEQTMQAGNKAQVRHSERSDCYSKQLYYTLRLLSSWRSDATCLALSFTHAAGRQPRKHWQPITASCKLVEASIPTMLLSG